MIRNVEKIFANIMVLELSNFVIKDSTFANKLLVLISFSLLVRHGVARDVREA